MVTAAVLPPAMTVAVLVFAELDDEDDQAKFPQRPGDAAASGVAIAKLMTGAAQAAPAMTVLLVGFLEI
ncbi:MULTISPECIES: hypothetical protein [unclassified Pseudoclavibacter]|uniref:hypothetical protein n=1 Tax=unclassified Pseudoclavibacter TaxID=2615177 RepID=UPI0011B015BD|nr:MULTISPECIES: hypothetical protein [unclassified Pseudoclavibacter]